MRMSGLATLTELAAGQWGLVTTAQAHQAGISRMQLSRLVEAGILDRVAHGVYATPAVLGDELLGLRAAWIALQPRRAVVERLADPVRAGVVSHASAAQLHGLGDLLADEHELTLPTRYQSTRPGVRVHRGTLTPADVTLVAGLPVTTAARTVRDLLAAGHDLEHVGQVAADAVRHGAADTRALVRALEPVVRRYDAADAAALTAQLLQAGGLAPRALGDRLVGSDAGADLVARSLGDRVARSPETAKLVEDLITLVGTAASSPGLRAGLGKRAERIRETVAPVNETLAGKHTSTRAAARARLAAAMPSPETRQRISAWLEDPDNQTVLQQLLLALQAAARATAAPSAPDADDEDDDVVEGEDRPRTRPGTAMA
ncbi:type IV toxin-antitoxin system AbiEi family antitoxin domain-containing protein [Georgenia sp. TF02-10]|uniref:type IV toxin-antitoxin system AbiEi family antitoxin domain-containing protein n=1 Tax=Georgenia sp. TF02-10 TaxID=2917725 RepID=UPI001FA74461|nr:type IV toxin-antitoxin system AbiEi family antitoxin domain-containing protein [Georgenia sp. TF02-10]UNX54628.1 type IV toxin-antitoxin system AbiEi family antitoxin domain-containing protein [Georgenia sp. TF02-10]